MKQINKEHTQGRPSFKQRKYMDAWIEKQTNNQGVSLMCSIKFDKFIDKLLNKQANKIMKGTPREDPISMEGKAALFTQTGPASQRENGPRLIL